MEQDAEYWASVRARAAELGSDGCTGVTQAFHDCCFEHDVHYRTGMRLDGTPITRRAADAAFRRCIQSRSVFGKMSPMSWWRWLGVRVFGRGAYKGVEHGKAERT